VISIKRSKRIAIAVAVKTIFLLSNTRLLIIAYKAVVKANNFISFSLLPNFLNAMFKFCIL